MMVMPHVIRRLLLSAVFCVPITAATAQTVVLPPDAQLGPRPFYLVDKMKVGLLFSFFGACFGFFCVPITAATAQTVVLPPDAQLGPRPFYLVDKMKDGPLKTKLGACTGPFRM